MAKGSGRAAPALVLVALAASWGRGSAEEPTAAGCPAPFPYQSATLSELCYTHASYATAGSGPCGSWCTFDAAVGSGCGDNSERLCTRWCDADSVVPATQAACEEAAEAAGLSKGCGGSAFAGAYSGNGGCYTYTEGDYQGCAFWSSAEAIDVVLGDGKERVCLPWPRYDGSIHWSPPPEIASCGGWTCGHPGQHCANYYCCDVSDANGAYSECNDGSAPSPGCWAAAFPDRGRCDLAHSCSGYSCSIEGQYCAPDKVGASGQPWCCVKGEWTPGTCPCKPGYGWDGPTTACKKCGDDADIWDPSWWEDGECTCVDGRTGPNCELLECASTTPTVSLGFLLLEVQWPRHARKLSRNEAFSGISAAFRAFDANSDNHLSVDEARTGIADGGMAVPSEVVHIWSRTQENGMRVEIHETASSCTENADCSVEGQYCPSSGYCCVGLTWAAETTCSGDVTITNMIQDELERLETQGTKDFYEQPSGSGAITAMEATYPSPLTTNNECKSQNEANPLLEWTVDRSDNTIFQQCAFFNGARLASDDGWDDDISSGDKCNDVAAENAGDECSYTFQLGDYVFVSHHHHQDLWPADSKTVEVGACGQPASECPSNFPYQSATLPELCYNMASYATAGSGPCGSWCTFDAAVGSGCGDNSGRICSEACPADFPYQSATLPELCYTDVSYATAGSGPCGSWCTFDAAVGSGCGDNSGRICSEGCNLGSIQMPKNYELSFTIKIDDGGLAFDNKWNSIIHVADPNGLSPDDYYPALFFYKTNKMYVYQTKSDGGNDNIQSTTVFEAGKTYDIVVISINSKLSLYVDGKREDHKDNIGGSPADGELKVGWSGGKYPPAAATISNARFAEVDVLTISKHSYCVETKFCSSDALGCNSATADPALTVTRCTTGLQYDGTPMDIFPRVLGPLGVSISWLYTSTTAKTYRVYKYDPELEFKEDPSARLLREIVASSADCGLTYDPLDFRDTTTGSEPGIEVGYAIVPFDDTSGAEDRDRAGASGFVVTWFGDVVVEVDAEGGGPVKDVVVKLTHLDLHGNPDPAYTNFVQGVTDDFGEVTLEVRVQDPAWTALTQHFRVEVEKTSERKNKPDVVHKFEPAAKEGAVRHLSELPLRFIDETAVSISGTVSHAGFDLDYFAANCPHRKSDGTCICSVDGAQVFIKRASGAVEDVPLLEDGTFSTAVFLDEPVTLGLRMYNGTNGVVPHNFTVTHDAGDDATGQMGAEPTFNYTASEDAEVHFLDVSTQSLSAALIVFADQQPAEYVNGLPMVASVERCGWERPAWTLRGVATVELGAAAFNVRVLGADEAEDVKYYHPPGGVSEASVPDCEDTERNDMVFGDNLGSGEKMIRGCRAKIPDVSASATTRLPCATMDYTYVDELPATRDFDVDLSNITDTPAVEFVIVSPLCLASVSAAAASGKTLHSLLTHEGARENEYDLSDVENLLLSPPNPEDDGSMYGKACTANTDAVFREKDEVEYTFNLVEREPECYDAGLYPWGLESGLCYGYKDAAPQTDHEIKIRAADAVTGEDTDDVYSSGSYSHKMVVGKPNPFAPFSKELTVEFTRAYDGAEIAFVRHALILGVLPEEVPQVWTAATNPTLIFSVLRDPPGGASTATLNEGSTISTSMAIEGAHAAELAAEINFGLDLGWEVDATAGGCLGGLASSKILGIGGGAGFSYSNTPTDITVERTSSRNFDIGISFSTAISTSDSPYIAGQPSDVIIGGGANLRFIKSIEIYATASGSELCLGGQTTTEFLPESITTYVTSVYEIEKLIERAGALLGPGNAIQGATQAETEAKRADLVQQIQNWQKVLADYRQITKDNSAESVANLLSKELDEFHVMFKTFLDQAANTEQRSEFSDFLARGLNQLAQGGVRNDQSQPELPFALKLKLMLQGKDPDAMMTDSSGHDELKSFERNLKDRVNKAAHQCETAANFVADGDSNLCWVYHDLSQKIELKESLLGICDFDRTHLDSGVADAASCTGWDCSTENQLCPRGVPGAADSDYCCVSGKWVAGQCGSTLGSVTRFCQKDHYRSGDPASTKMGAFGAFADTTQYLTFSGTTGLEFEWTVDEARGQDFTSTHDASVDDSIGGSFSFGGEVGRRRLGDEVMPIYAYTSSAGQAGRRLLGVGIPGYAYPTTGHVHAVSKKLLEVTPEALAERRRQLITEEAEALERRRLDNHEEAEGSADAEPEAPEFGGNPCRRLDGNPLSEEERRRLGVTGCFGTDGGTSSSLSVSLSRAESKGSEHSHTVAISMKDDNIQDSFAVQVSMDPVYGTPMFTTLGGRSSCPGETGTTRRDSRVTIEQIRPLCASNGEPCNSVLACKCENLEPGEDAFFSVVLQNLSPWEDSVTYYLRAGFGPATAWNAAKYNDTEIECDSGDPGNLAITDLSTDNYNLRDGTGVILDPLDYGQFEVLIKVSLPEFALQCSTFHDIELELVSECENTDTDGAQDVYQYLTSEMDDNGNFEVTHPVWDADELSFTEATVARGTDASSASFSVCWGENCGDELETMRKSSSSSDGGAATASAGFAVPAALLILVLIAAAVYMYRRRNLAPAKETQKEATGGDAVAADANYDAINVETDETNKVDQDVEKAPLRPTAYPGGQSLPPWPYPEAKPAARPTPSSYDPACIRKVSWPRDAARPTEFALRETFEALAPVTNVGLGSGNAAMVIFKDAAGARAAEAAYDGPWRVAAAKPPAAAADQPPPPPPKTGDV